MLLSNTTKEFINLAISKLELENPTQETINRATNYLKDAILQIKKEKEKPREYKVWLFNALYDTNYVENEFVNALTGNFQSQNTYKHTDYIEIPSGVKELTLILPICGNVGYHVGAFYDKDKKFLYGVSPNASSKYHMTEETLKIALEGNEKYLVLGSSSSGDLANAYYISSEEAKKVFMHESDSVYSVNTVEELKTIEAKTGDTIITKGYYEIGDNGEAIYDIVTYEEYATLLPKDIQFEIQNAGRDIKEYMSNVVGEASESICLTRPDNTLNKEGRVYIPLKCTENEFKSKINHYTIQNENTIDSIAKKDAIENPFN